jgi:tetratricopeptide (TPR) repeat protein
MNLYFMILVVGLIYIVGFGGISLVRREGLSAQFALEVLGLTALVELWIFLTGTSINPVLFLALIYVVSMRVRLLVDIGNMLSNRGRQRDAIRILQFALRLYPDKASRLVALVNMGIVQLRRKNPESAKELFEIVLKDADGGGLGVKYEAACRYNLGLALQQQGKDAEAVSQFSEVAIIYPSSIYGQAAEKALEKRRSRQQSGIKNESESS